MAKVAKRQSKKVVEKPVQRNPLEVPHLRVIEADVARLGEAFNHNAQLFGHSLTVAEMRLRVLERAMHDMLRGVTKVKTVDGLLQVDFEAYVNEFALCMVMTEFAVWCKQLMDNAAPPVTLSSNSYENVLEFGGSP
jgi:hypothetical protein